MAGVDRRFKVDKRLSARSRSPMRILSATARVASLSRGRPFSHRERFVVTI